MAMITSPMPMASPYGWSSGKVLSQAPHCSPRVAPPYAPAPIPMTVMSICTVERKPLGSSMSRSAAAARREYREFRHGEDAVQQDEQEDNEYFPKEHRRPFVIGWARAGRPEGYCTHTRKRRRLRGGNAGGWCDDDAGTGVPRYAERQTRMCVIARHPLVKASVLLSLIAAPAVGAAEVCLAIAARGTLG